VETARLLLEESRTNKFISDYFRCPDGSFNFEVAENLSDESGYFKFGPGLTCFGQCSSGKPSHTAKGDLVDVEKDLQIDGSLIRLPFDPDQVVDNLLFERYWPSLTCPGSSKSFVRKIYYFFRPFMKVALRKHLQRLYLSRWKTIAFPAWPVDFSVDNLMRRLLEVSIRSQQAKQIPFIWFWPDGAPGCALVTHDVETTAGRDFCAQLMDLNDRYGIKSAFQVVPEERYEVPPSFLEAIRKREFEVNIHDLNHDGRLLEDRKTFLQRVEQINRYGRSFCAKGFRSGALYRNLDWFEELDFSYDMSVPNAGHLEAQRGGCCTVLPFFNGDLLEIPVTMTQDYSLFNVLKNYSIDQWKKETAQIMGLHGLMCIIVHPDYIISERERRVYEQLLQHLQSLRDNDRVWITTPSEVDQWWRERAQMKLVADGDKWRIEGVGKERARIAYARIESGRLVYSLTLTVPQDDLKMNEIVVSGRRNEQGIDKRHARSSRGQKGRYGKGRI
jgi:hypothetical protein